ncbi:MAG: tRNA uridine-5-carboxymethylaminomethyl(34) synthesis GTPase MnmE [Bacteroidales bacterium]|jgi:tRNA modification GTPase|nr:tRNA uridine-5-carboxymethylaminomethyl(34) synthesis GTPase MnmE [Bacteroidales bacterium]MDD2424512.1 tRNA uridine-5-carboxymethylaminomethyl(34) synthesis GTPase MnmE [Bacteroidales bacterium]MDD3988506.1 tRNA uridine-5-carboxymethylaminomethyl(34) synthesis GTPase MnmE [Bacteroidales bacterium]
MNEYFDISETICAISSPPGVGALAVIRISGKNSIFIISRLFEPFKGSTLSETRSHSLRYGVIKREGEILDEVVVSLFRAPHSFTGEESAEIYCHGSTYIQQEIIRLLVDSGIRMALPGEFSKRAFLNGKMDLAQAEAVADLISSETLAAHKNALSQMRGGFSKELAQMRKNLLNLVSLMELELDFSDEDVEFADRGQLKAMVSKSIEHISLLIESFKLGNVVKNGVPVAIVGATNTGKSTLLNAILGEERAIVSDIHGTTRDYIEDLVNLGGVMFRFIDTAGIRKSTEQIEILGIERTFEKIRSASVVILVLDAECPDNFFESVSQLKTAIDKGDQKVIILLNKIDTVVHPEKMLREIKKIAESAGLTHTGVMAASAKNGEGLDNLKSSIIESQINISFTASSTLVTNSRHYQALTFANEALKRVESGLEKQLSTDLLTQDIREALFHIGEIVGEVSTEEVLGNIFSKFCIGK